MLMKPPSHLALLSFFEVTRDSEVMYLKRTDVSDFDTLDDTLTANDGSRTINIAQ